MPLGGVGGYRFTWNFKHLRAPYHKPNHDRDRNLSPGSNPEPQAAAGILARMTPTQPGKYLYTPDLPGAESVAVDVVRYKGALMVRLPDDDEVELHPVEDLSGTWS
jgi:hypothetical protein